MKPTNRYILALGAMLVVMLLNCSLSILNGLTTAIQNKESSLLRRSLALSNDSLSLTTPATTKVHIITVADKAFRERYDPIFEKMGKYAQRHGYTWNILDPKTFEEQAVECQQYSLQEFFFKKHCWISKWMELLDLPSLDIVFVVDSDVVPFRASIPLDHWTDFSEDFVFYIRSWSNEIAAGNYAVRNTVAAREFLRTWAGYENQKPVKGGYSSADNGALHLHLLRSMGLELKFPPGKCADLWTNLSERVTNLTQYWAYVTCTREHLPEDTHLENGALSVRILSKGTAFVIDYNMDTYGIDGSGLAGGGPVFHHGVKIHKTGHLQLNLVEKYNLTDLVTTDKAEEELISCGGHMARSCESCPDLGEGAATYCNGECHWCEYGGNGTIAGKDTEGAISILHRAQPERCVSVSNVCRTSILK